MVTFNITSRTPSSALDDSEPTLLLFNRGPGAVLVGVTEIFDRAKAMLLRPRRAARLAVTGGRVTVVPADPGSRAVLDVTVEARRTPAQCASVRADRPVDRVNLVADSLGFVKLPLDCIGNLPTLVRT